MALKCPSPQRRKEHKGNENRTISADNEEHQDGGRASFAILAPLR